MSRRSGQNPSVRIGKRADGSKYYFFQYYVDVAGQEKRRRETEVLGSTGKMNKSEAERKKTDLILKLGLNSSEYRIPSTETFASAVKHYLEVWAPDMLRASTRNVARYHIANYLSPDWGNTPIEHVTIEAINDWARGKRQSGMKWSYIKKVLQTMHRVLSCRPKAVAPFSLKGLRVEERPISGRCSLAVSAVSGFVPV